MIITTSRRPDHAARILSRQLARVIPRSRQVTRGRKTVQDVADIARRLGHGEVMIVSNVSGEQRDLRFLRVGQDWRWENARVEIEEVEFQRFRRGIGGFECAKMCAPEGKTSEFAEWFRRIVGLECEVLPGSVGTALATADDGIRLVFRRAPGSSTDGPALRISGFGRLYGGEGKQRKFWRGTW